MKKEKGLISIVKASSKEARKKDQIKHQIIREKNKQKTKK